MRCPECKQGMELARSAERPEASEYYCARCHLSTGLDGSRRVLEPATPDEIASATEVEP